MYRLGALHDSVVMVENKAFIFHNFNSFTGILTHKKFDFKQE